MIPFRFIHTADLHLDTPFSGLSQTAPSIASVLYEATFNSLQNIVRCCIEKHADFLLISGDIYTSADQSLKAQLRFRTAMEKLGEHSIQVYICSGNHDPLDGWSAHIEWPENVHMFGGTEVASFSFQKEGEHVAEIYGISYSRRDITDNLSREFPSAADSGVFNIGMLHCNVGSNPEYAVYAPCSLTDLSDRKLDYWALGHIHDPRILKQTSPAVVYPGSPQGLTPNDTGPRGCYEVTVDSLKTTEITFTPADSVRWESAEIPIDDAETEQELLDRLNETLAELREEAEHRPVLCRISLTGRGPLHRTLSRPGFTEDLTDDLREQEESEKLFVWVQRIDNRTKADLDIERLKKRDDFISDLIREFELFRTDPDLREGLRDVLDELYTQQHGRKYISRPDQDTLTEIIETAMTLCLDRLAGDA